MEYFCRQQQYLNFFIRIFHQSVFKKMKIRVCPGGYTQLLHDPFGVLDYLRFDDRGNHIAEPVGTDIFLKQADKVKQFRLR